MEETEIRRLIADTTERLEDRVLELERIVQGQEARWERYTDYELNQHYRAEH